MAQAADSTTFVKMSKLGSPAPPFICCSDYFNPAVTGSMLPLALNQRKGGEGSMESAAEA